MKSLRSYLSIIIFFSFFYSCSIFNISNKVEFVKVKRAHFSVGNSPYYFLGTNFWYGAYLGAPTKFGDRERLIKELDMLEELGINNLRVLVASENSEIRNSLKPTFQISPGKYNESLLIGMDFLLSEMAKRNMRAVVFLNNYWEWSGGMGQYLAWADGVKPKDPSKSPWPEYNIFVNSFYRNSKANKLFRNYIKTIVNRKNSFTGVKYFKDPTIMAWELANEPRPGQGEDGEKYINQFYNWVDSTAGYIKSLDPYHLVTTGNEGEKGSLESGKYFKKMHESENIDYMTFHLWAKNWSWFDAQDPEATFENAKEKAKNYIKRHIEYADSLRKPITLEEFGLGRNHELFSPESPVTLRDTYFKSIFQQVYEGMKNKNAIAGVNFWSWGGLGRAQHEDAKWRKNDPFTGDPPQEPQGLNSVFSSDLSTLNLIKSFAKKINNLNNSNWINTDEK